MAYPQVVAMYLSTKMQLKLKLIFWKSLPKMGYLQLICLQSITFVNSKILVGVRASPTTKVLGDALTVKSLLKMLRSSKERRCMEAILICHRW